MQELKRAISALTWLLMPLYVVIIYLTCNDLNEAQGQPAFAKTTEAIPCRLDFFVRGFSLIFLRY